MFIDQEKWFLENIPREFRGPLNARVWLDAAGQLNIELDGGGGLTLIEEVAGTWVVTDDAA